MLLIAFMLAVIALPIMLAIIVFPAFMATLSLLTLGVTGVGVGLFGVVMLLMGISVPLGQLFCEGEAYHNYRRRRLRKLQEQALQQIESERNELLKHAQAELTPDERADLITHYVALKDREKEIMRIRLSRRWPWRVALKAREREITH
jgi:hypothetical protein